MTLAGRTAAGLPSEIERDITEQIEVHASRALSKLLRRVLIALGWSGAGVLGGVGGAVALDEDPPPAAPDGRSVPEHPGGVTDSFPVELLIPPADEHLLDACDRSGADARRAIRESRICIDMFAAARESCDALGADVLVPRAGPPTP